MSPPLRSNPPPVLVVHPEPPPPPDPVPSHPLFMTVVGMMATFIAVFSLRVARDFVLPIVVAILLSLLFSPVVRWLRRHGVREHFGAALVVFGTLAVVVGGALALAGPATDWLAEAPASLARAETRIRQLIQPLMVLQRTAERVQEVATSSSSSSEPAKVSLASPGLLARWSSSTLTAIVSALSVVFLTYFLLASGPLFRRKLAEVLPSRLDRVRLVTLFDEIELVTSRYLLTSMMINAGVAAATATGLWLVGMPNPMLWGAMAGLFNFIPYLGAFTTTTILAIAALSIRQPQGPVHLAPIVFLGIHLVEGNLVTPTILGKRLPVSALAIFFGLLFWGWVWGIPGAILAVPLTVVVKVTCDHLPGLRRIGELLDN